MKKHINNIKNYLKTTYDRVGQKSKNKFKSKLNQLNNWGFTLIEILISISILILLLPQIWTFSGDLLNRSFVNKLNSENLSSISILNSQLSNIIKNSFWIVYNETITDAPINPNQDTLTLYVDKHEKQKISIFVEQDLNNDISRLMIKYNNNSPKPLNSSSTFIEEFNITTSENPNTNPTFLSIQPNIWIKIKIRSRSPLRQVTADEYYNLYNKSEAYLSWRWIIRNYTPSSLKN